MNSPRKRKALADFIQQHHIDIVAIQETKKEEFSHRILNYLSRTLDVWLYVPSVGRSGGILFGGDSNKIDIISHSQHKYCLDIHFTNKVDSTIWQFTIVYGPTLRHLKKDLWKELNLVREGHFHTWVLCGDFNVIRSPQDKSGPAFDIQISTMFNTFINKHCLVEHKLHSRKFTWSNGRQFALLDRFFTTLDWERMYPHSRLIDLSKNGSDHCPLVVQLHDQSPTKLPQFKFDPLWLEDADFITLVQKWWAEQPLSLPDIAHSWNKKLGSLRKKIKGWAKNHYGRKKKEKILILNKLHELEIIQEDRSFTDAEYSDWKALKIQLENIFLEEEKYWKHRSKQQWLNEGDQNSKFFHVMVNHRKKKNRINSLEINNQVTQSLVDIKNHVHSYYIDLLGTAGHKMASFDDKFWDDNDKVNPEENSLLQLPFTLEEIKKALFDCAPNGILVLTVFHLNFINIFGR